MRPAPTCHPSAAHLPARPALLPHLRPLWRNLCTVQLGTDPTNSVIIEFGHPPTARLLDLLDGTRSQDEVLAYATTLGMDRDQTIGVLETLANEGLLVSAESLLPEGVPDRARRRMLAEAGALAHDTPTTRSDPPAEALRRRRAARVSLIGERTLVAGVATALAAAGVGRIEPTADGSQRYPDVVDAMLAIAPEVDCSPIRRRSATLVMQVGVEVPTSPVRGAPVLAVDIRDGAVTVGPLLSPSGSPCGRCLDLHRLDRDPAWPVLAAQLAARLPVASPCAVTTLLAGVAFTADEMLRFIDGRPVRTAAATVEIRSPGRSRRRSWAAHPACGCTIVTGRPGPDVQRDSAPGARAGRNDG